jgi:acetyl-CoA acetyltransferase
VHAAATFGHYATAHMARFGTTSLDFAHLAVTQRKHATLNEKAIMRKPLTLEEHQKSRWVVYPYRLLPVTVFFDDVTDSATLPKFRPLE